MKITCSCQNFLSYETLEREQEGEGEREKKHDQPYGDESSLLGKHNRGGRFGHQTTKGQIVNLRW
jgi:hypothetical protein